MGFRIEKEKTSSTPYILVDEEQHYMKFEGESFHENVIAYYQEVCEWLKNYLHTNFSVLTFDCCMQYFNSSTTKLLLNMLLDMDAAAVNGKKIIVNWITTKDNEIILECGEDFQEEMKNLQFELVIKD